MNESMPQYACKTCGFSIRWDWELCPKCGSYQPEDHRRDC